MQTTTLFSLVLVLISHVMAWWEDKGAEAATVEPPAEVAAPAEPEATPPAADGCAGKDEQNEETQPETM